jgi:hypothetical protein
MALDLAQALGEHAPHRLQEEVPQHVGASSATVTEPGVEVGEVADGEAGHRYLGFDEHWLLLGQEHE